MKLSLAQYDVARADAASNLTRIGELASRSKAADADLVCLPEMCTTGFDWEYNRGRLDSAADDAEMIASIAKSEKIAICGSLLEKTESGGAANTFYYFDASGKLLAKYRKLHLFTLFHEERHVEAGDTCVSFETEHGSFGATICYDLRFPELYRRLTKMGADLHFVPAAFPHPRLEHWQALLRARAIENQVFVVATNQAGIEGHGSDVGKISYFGHSMVIDPWGKTVVEAREEPCLLSVEIELSQVAEVRAKLSAWEDRRTDQFHF
jgi:predicted amidohydrolase